MAEGIKHEDDALTLYMKERGYTNIDTQMYKIINFGNFDVVGMCDGLLVDRIIEIKNRNNGRFKNGPWLSEKCQCQMYMFMFGLNKCDFVEHHRGHIVTSELYRDDKFINETIMPKLKKFIDENRKAGYTISIDLLLNKYSKEFIDKCIKNNLLIKKGEEYEVRYY